MIKKKRAKFLFKKFPESPFNNGFTLKLYFFDSNKKGSLKLKL
jgi:hypothetical protein